VFASTSARRSGSLIRWMCVPSIFIDIAGSPPFLSSSISCLSFVPHFFFCISSLFAPLFFHRLALLIVHFYPSLRRSRQFQYCRHTRKYAHFSVTLFPL
jgi:hypothetical protein